MQKFREIVFQFLYSRDFEKCDWEAIEPLVMRQLLIPKRAAREAKAKAEAIWEKCEELDQKIAEKSSNYDLKRVPRVELTILRLGAFELLFSDLPPKVAISEAIRITRKYATVEGATFVNAVLDALYKEKEGAAVSEEQIS